MKIEYILLNFLAFALSVLQALSAKYDIIPDMIATDFAVFLIVILPIVLFIINYRVSKRAFHLVILNLIFTLCQVAGLCIYDIILFGRVAESYWLLAPPTVAYSLIITCVTATIKFFKSKPKKHPNGKGEKIKNIVSNLMLVVGAVALIIGFILLFFWDGLPYQDITLEQLEKWMFYHDLGHNGILFGVTLIIIGVIMKLFCKDKEKSNDGKRLLAFIIDTMIAGFVCSSLLIFRYYFFALVVGLLVYLLKDAVKGQSIGKNVTKLKVTNINGDTPKLSSLIIRNITLVIWPVEAILVLFGKPRLGDRLAKTMVVESCDKRG